MDMASTERYPRTLAELKDYLLDCGACTVGVADLSACPQAQKQGYEKALAIGVALRPESILRLRNQKARPVEADRPATAALEALAAIAVEHLQALGAKAQILRSEDTPGALTHEEVAVEAGVAWLGKSGRAVTWDFGSAVRFIAVLTDAGLPADKPVDQSFCGTCLMCTQGCLAHAPSGTLWSPGMKRSDLVNEAACEQRRRELLALGRECRYCMSVCPFTIVYLVNSGTNVPTEPSQEP